MADKTCLICQGTGCVSAGSREIHSRLEEELSKLENGDSVEVKRTGCHGFCEKGPLVVVEPEGLFYAGVSVDDVPSIAQTFFPDGEPLTEGPLYKDPSSGEPVTHYKDINFYSKQQRTVLKNCGNIDPENIEESISRGGYDALKKTLSEYSPDDVLEEVKKAGLRGLGGAGFPTWIKWDFCMKAEGERKYLVCNADEGDPGAFQDRSILEGDPNALIEGMIIAGYTLGASKGYIYVRAEYPLAIYRLQIAIAQAREKGFIGEKILGSDFNFELEIFQGAGAFVCGEETALLASIEGERGMPRPRPPFPAQSGLWGYPTIINNVKSYSSLRWIINKGSGWFSGIGTETCKGTAIFSLTGKVSNSGIVEVPMGITLREIIFGIGDGIPDNKPFKAVQTGGPSGGCLPADMLDTPVDFDSLKEAGSMMGSGGMVVMDDDTCIVDLARYFVDFGRKESCGECAPCRLGTKQMYDILEDITNGKGTMDDLKLLEELGQGIKNGSLCGLGQTAPNPVLSTLKYFRDEYIEHVVDKKCRSRVCKELKFFEILPDKCTGCHICFKACPVDAITGNPKELHLIDQELCIKCGMCMEKCPPKFNAIEVYPGSKNMEA
jgi:NADH:ubiquinone oxidoreductase subunit F (NADH-binding)/(2Fe-2S) ferredoxin/Pyruvate/2-oxoacid:ferredoxin oxidoreductase delta subunit